MPEQREQETGGRWSRGPALYTSGRGLSRLARVFPLASIPEWITSQVFYGLLSRVLTYLLLPLLLGYAAYRIVASLLRPGVQGVVGEIAWDAVLLATAVVLFILVLQRTAARTMAPLRSGVTRAGEAAASVRQIQELLVSDHAPPLRRDLAGHRIGVFVPGHTHVPALSRRERDGGPAAVIANSGCWLRQLHPIAARFGAPPVFVAVFVQAHVRIRLREGRVQVELWQRPRPAQHRLRAIERLAILGRGPAQPPATAPPELVASETL